MLFLYAVPSLGQPANPSCDPLDGRGSLLYYPNIEIKWDAASVITQDTTLRLRNHHVFDVSVQLYFINGDAPVHASVKERAHPGWNAVDCQVSLGRLELLQGSANSSALGLCQPLRVLDPGSPPGRPDPDGPAGSRMLRGYAIAWAVDARGGQEISWNYLSGSAGIVDVSKNRSWGYDAYAFRAISASEGEDTDCTPGQLLLDGVEYETPYATLIFDFDASGTVIVPPGANQALSDTDLTLVPTSVDLRQDNLGPVTTKARFSIWNEMGTRLSGTERCVSCWDQQWLSQYGAPNNLLRSNLLTDQGVAQIDGLGSGLCPGGQASSLLGVFHETLTSLPAGNLGDLKWTGGRLQGAGRGSGKILYDIIEPPCGPDEGNDALPSVVPASTANGDSGQPIAEPPFDAEATVGACISPAVVPHIVSSVPASGVIDAREPVGGLGSWDRIYVRFDGDSCDLQPSDFDITVTPSVRSLSVDRIIPNCDDATLVLTEPIPPGARTIITHWPSGTSVCLRHLPGDADGNGTSGPVDILHLVDHLNGYFEPPMALHQCDINRSCQCGTSDIIALVDLLNGAGPTGPWLFVSVPQCPAP